MKANKRIRDLKRRSDRRLFIETKDGIYGTTTFPVDNGPKTNDVQEVKIKRRAK